MIKLHNVLKLENFLGLQKVYTHSYCYKANV